MPRTARASVGGVCYYVISRGNGRPQVFHPDADSRAFLKAIGHACIEIPLPVLGYGEAAWQAKAAERLGLDSTLRPRKRLEKTWMSNFLPLLPCQRRDDHDLHPRLNRGGRGVKSTLDGLG